ncbi:BspA family leucine-rich repeat surface protein, partial [Enterococcus faecalis]
AMFSKTTSLKSLNLSNFDTRNVTSMNSMFSEASSLESLNLSSFITDKVTDMIAMFSKTTSLKSLNLSNFDTRNVTSMNSMFSEASSLESLNLSSFITDKVTDMIAMFYNTSALRSLNLSNFSTSKVTNMYGMFSKTTSLKSLNLANFDTRNVTSMNSMFSEASSLESLNLSNFITDKVTDMGYMFYNVSNLTHLTLGQKSKFNRSVHLPAIPQTDSYTGNWVNQADPSINMGISDQFMDAYDGSHPGTYVWELGKVDIQSIDPISFGTQTIKEKNSATTRSTITIKDTLPQRTTQRWKLMVRYDSTDAQTKQWLAAQLKLSFSPHSDQPFLNLPTTLTVGEENQQIAELPDESKKGTQINQSIALNPQLQASGRILVGMYRAQLLWDLEATPTT